MKQPGPLSAHMMKRWIAVRRAIQAGDAAAADLAATRALQVTPWTRLWHVETDMDLGTYICDELPPGWAVFRTPFVVVSMETFLLWSESTGSRVVRRAAATGNSTMRLDTDAIIDAALSDLTYQVTFSDHFSPDDLI